MGKVYILDTAGIGSYNLGQNRWEICNPPPPQIKDGKMARFGFCAASSLLWGGWGFAVPFYSVQDCLRASTSVTHSVMYSNHDNKSVHKRFKAQCFQSKPGHLSVNSYKTEELCLFNLYKMNKKIHLS